MSAEDDEIQAFVDRPRVVRWLRDGSTFLLTRFVVLRLLGVVYFVAFASAYVQAPALIGERGLMPMSIALADHAARAGRLRAVVESPSIFWLAHGDAALRGACLLGAALALAVTLGVTNAAVMLVLWILQLSLAHVGQTFWGYGWELQLCETGILGALLCPLRTLRPLARVTGPPESAIWLLRWLVVRVMLGAGLIKLRGDPCWRDLTCLVFHYETQPNPSPVSWVLNGMPPWFHHTGVRVNHFVELVVPWFVLGPRPLRRAAGALFVAFQAMLIVSGNLSFLNWLTIVPALACFDDELLARAIPARFRAAILERARDAKPSRGHARLAGAYAFLVVILSVGPVANMLSPHQQMNMGFEPLELVNTYGAFGSVTRERDEVVIEGTSDEAPGPATVWKEYELPCKPGDPRRRPCLVSPWHYRLDWQMWFAGMSSIDDEPWLAELALKLLRGDRAVAPLLAKDPFPDAPPRFVRAELFRYEMTSRDARDARAWTARGRAPSCPECWWRRAPLGEYLRPVSKDDPALLAFLRDHRLPR